MSLCAEITVDPSSLLDLLDELVEIAPEVAGMGTAELNDFTKSAFYVHGQPAVGADGPHVAVWKPFKHYMQLLPALRAGEITFSAFEGILKAKAGIANDPRHNAPPQ